MKYFNFSEPTEVVSAGFQSQDETGDAAIATDQPASTVPALPVETGAPDVTAATAPARPVAMAVGEASTIPAAPATSADEVTLVNPDDEPPVPFPAQAAAVIGADAQTSPAARTANRRLVEPADWGAYAGFVGILFLLSALALLVYRRRRDYRRAVGR